MERLNLREIIEQAIQTEKLGYQFYTNISQKFRDNAGLNNLFTTLAEKELKHEQAFRELLDVTGNEEIEGIEDVSMYMRAIVESEFFLGKNKSLPSLHNIKNIDDALNFAIGFEKETLLYFHGLRDAVKEKEVVDEIINEEKSHIRWLTSFRDKFVKGKK